MNYLTRLIAATRYSWTGIAAALRHEAAFRTEVAILPLAVAGAFYFGDNSIERLLLIGSWLLVLIVELINSAIEATVDRVGSEQHKLSGRAKDMGSGAVHLAIIVASAIWLTLLLDL
ncbi:MAG TPA: diacylglycerol kinase [Mariprofundaceae bacterium]|nr:diacylglycerol kinase [Mariprofundaceae bacterium]